MKAIVRAISRRLRRRPSLTGLGSPHGTHCAWCGGPMKLQADASFCVDYCRRRSLAWFDRWCRRAVEAKNKEKAR